MSAQWPAWVRRAAVGVAFAWVMLHAPFAAAQAIVDAGRAEFTPSADHTRTSGGVPVLTSYELRIFVAGATQVTRSVNLGKPSPGTDGLIRVNFLSLLTTPLLRGVIYEARVAAVGPGGSSASGLSNQFSFSACAPNLSSTSASFPASASSGSVAVTAASGCEWSASSPVSWISIRSGARGAGAGTVTFSVVANAATTSRSATLTIATRAFTVRQAGASNPCGYTIAPASRNAPAAGETVTVAVTTGSRCTWSVRSNARWLTFSGSASRTGGGNVSIVVARNTATAQRAGTVTIAGRTFSVTQIGACAYGVAPTTVSAAAAGSRGTITVTTGAGCRWNTTGVPSWITVPTGTRTGSGSLSYTVAVNPLTAVRRGSFTVAGRVIPVAQAASAPPSRPSGVRVLKGSGSRN